MQISEAQARIQQSGREAMEVLQKSQQVNTEMAEKMIRLSLEEKLSEGKTKLVNQLVDVYL
ncbi:MAG: hypothetical protein WAN36_02730 [Calditrichia bacterium]